MKQSVFILLFLISLNVSAHENLACILPSEEVYTQLQESDFTDPRNPAYRKPKPDSLCRIVFKDCPPNTIRHYSDCGEGKRVIFILTSQLQEEAHHKSFICEYFEPAPVTRGGANGPWYSLKPL